MRLNLMQGKYRHFNLHAHFLAISRNTANKISKKFTGFNAINKNYNVD